MRLLLAAFIATPAAVGVARANQVGPDLTIVNTTKTTLTEVQLVSQSGEHVSLTKNLAPGQQVAVQVETRTGGCT